MQVGSGHLDVATLKQNFWDPFVMKTWQDFFMSQNLKANFYLDTDNVLRLRDNGQGVAYVGGVKEKERIGLYITNPLRQQTSSFQYVFGLIEPIRREDNLLIGGTLGEFIDGPSLEKWLAQSPPGEESRLQIYSILAQLIYAATLLAKKGRDVGNSLTGIMIRQVDPNATVPFFEGRIYSYGVIPVIVELDKIQVNTSDVNPQDMVIPYFLDLLATTDHWSKDWETLNDIYSTFDVSDGMAWNELIGQEIYANEIADYSCQGRPCLGETKGPLQANGRTPLENLRYTRDLHLVKRANLPLPDHIRPFALSFLSYLSSLYPEDPAFKFEEKVDPALLQDYLDLALLQETYFEISNELSLLIADHNKQYRRFIYSDLQFGSPTNEFYIREDFVTPVLRWGDNYVFDRGTVVEGYNDETKTFTLRQGEGNLFRLGYEDFFDYIERVEGVQPYTLRSIPRQHVAIINGQISYHNEETGEFYPLPDERVLVRNVGNMLNLIYNAQAFLGLGLSLLYELQ